MTAAIPARRRRRFTPLLVAATGAAVLGLAMWNARENSDDLMPRAIRAVPAGVWRAESGYRWVSDHEVLQLMPTNAGGYEPVIWNTTPPPGAPHSRLVVTRPDFRAPGATPISLSPDGAWVLCKNTVPETGISAYFALALDGSKRRHDWPGLDRIGDFYGRGGVFWFADSRRFLSVELDVNKHVYLGRVISLGNLGESPPFRFPRIDRRPLVPVAMLGSDRFLAGDENSDSLHLDQGVAVPKTLTLTELGFGPGASPARTVTLAAPSVTARDVHSSRADRSFIISPRGDRILWVISAEREWQPMGADTAIGARFYPWLARVFPGFLHTPDYPIYQHELWTARFDGRGGLIRLGAITITKSEWPIFDWTWTPDGKRVSFTYNDALYTLPVSGPQKNVK